MGMSIFVRNLTVGVTMLVYAKEFPMRLWYEIFSLVKEEL